MDSFKPQGILPALVTPFSEASRQVNEEALRNLVDRCIEWGGEWSRTLRHHR